LGEIIIRLSLGLLESGVLLDFLLGRRHLNGWQATTFQAKSDNFAKGAPQNITCELIRYLRWGLFVWGRL
jgi:hypothetical protein